MSRLLLSTDLDGTLLDHYTYSAAPADKLFPLLERLNIPWIFNTSKTAPELIALRSQLANPHPFSVENGGAIYVPKGSQLAAELELQEHLGFYVIKLGLTRADILSRVEPFRSQFNFYGLSEISVDEMAVMTGLSHERAKLALDRNFSEPLVWRDSEDQLQRFSLSLSEMGIQVVKGGRFVHLQGEVSKAHSLAWLVDQYQTLWNTNVESIALGDGENDRAMLEMADIAIQVRSPVHSFPAINALGEVIQTDLCGPEGWYQAVKALIADRFPDAF